MHAHTCMCMNTWHGDLINLFLSMKRRKVGSKYTFYVTVDYKHKFFRGDIMSYFSNKCTQIMPSLFQSATTVLLCFNKNMVVPTERMAEFTVTQRYCSFVLKILPTEMLLTITVALTG